MSSSNLGIPKGTRDFGPRIMARRQFILQTIQKAFKKFAFQPLETPSMENLSVLTGKYGDEGDQLLYKILDSGDYLKKTSVEDYAAGAQKLLPKISGKGLRYDLTVPFARYVAMNRHDIVFPFKRYQMQPVWRADRPQKGRYREFYQCDADVIGTNSLLCETELIAMINEVFSELGIADFTIYVNHRKLLAATAEVLGAADNQKELAVSLDKLDKIGPGKVLKELTSKGFEPHQLEKLKPLFQWQGLWKTIRVNLQDFLGHTTPGKKGIEDLDHILGQLGSLVDGDPNVKVNPTLARGLAYYTGTIFEVIINNARIGSVCGGGRYDDLTGIFGLPEVSGVGISFGVDRIYDAMEQLKLFPEEQSSFSDVLLIALDDQCETYALNLLASLRKKNVSAELYPDRVKLKKPLNYASKNGIARVILIGPDEISNDLLTVKHMETGSQEQLTEAQVLALFKGKN